MSQASDWALQVAVIKALRNDGQLDALLGAGTRVHAMQAPEGQAFPYVIYMPDDMSDGDTMTEGGEEHIFTIHIWNALPRNVSAATRGRKASAKIAYRVRQILHNADFDITSTSEGPTGHRLVNLQRQFQDTRAEPGSTVLHTVIRFRAVTEEN